jgi:hypothetical protein
VETGVDTQTVCGLVFSCVDDHYNGVFLLNREKMDSHLVGVWIERMDELRSFRLKQLIDALKKLIRD